MLSVFPSILFLAPLGAVVIRVSVASLFALAAYNRFRFPVHGIEGTVSLFAYTIGVFETLSALSLAVGYWAQPGALLAMITLATWFFMGRPTRAYPLTTVILMFAICVSILVTGPGAFAFDLPL